MPLHKPLARPHAAPEPQTAAAVERATVLLVHGMQEADAPIADLSGALARMAAALADPAADVAALRATLARNIAVCVESLQSYDRLVQQLTQARDILTRLGPNSRPARDGGSREGRREGSVELF